MVFVCWSLGVFLCQAEDGIRGLVRSRGLGDVYKRQAGGLNVSQIAGKDGPVDFDEMVAGARAGMARPKGCLLYTSDAADERSSVDLGGRRIITKKIAS